jgi:hypothetical protein
MKWLSCFFSKRAGNDITKIEVKPASDLAAIRAEHAAIARVTDLAGVPAEAASLIESGKSLSDILQDLVRRTCDPDSVTIGLPGPPDDPKPTTTFH